MRLIAGGTKNPIVNPNTILITRTKYISLANPVTKIVADHMITARDITVFLLNLSLMGPATKLDKMSGTMKAGPIKIP
jgi:hypothetical protein